MSREKQMSTLSDAEPQTCVTKVMRPKLARALQVSSLAFLLAACGERPADMAEMSETITATLTETTAPDVVAAREAVDLRAGFAQAVRSAVVGNEGFRAALALETSAMGQIGVASSMRRPRVTGNTALGGIRESGGNTPDSTTTGVSGGFNISQLLYDGGESAAAVNQATAEALGARAERETRGNELALQAARAWVDVWQFEQRLQILRSRTSEMDTMVAQMERMALNGFVDRAALDSARRQIVDITLEETRLEADLRDARVRFQRFYNRAPEAIGLPTDFITPAAARIAAGAWQQAPGLERSAAELLIARSAVASAKAAFRPRARLQAGVSTPMQEGESTDTSVGLVLEYTFGDGGRRKSLLEAAQARARAVEAQLADAQRTLEAELDAALTRLAAIERSMPLVAEQMRLSASEAETARSQITTGQSTLRQLVEAEIENYRACDRQIAMRAERQILLLTIAARTGELGFRIGLD
jgi:outer membrane protein TolC